MKIKIIPIITLLLMTMCTSNYAQYTYTGHHTLKDQIKIDTIIDKTNGNKFILDKERIYIKALDKEGKLLWKTDPSVDNKIEEYRVKRPVIIYFAFDLDNGKEVIWITYNNTQFGTLNKENGAFDFHGQD